MAVPNAPTPTAISVSGPVSRVDWNLGERAVPQLREAVAELSAQFIRSQLYNGTIILDTISISDCSMQPKVVSYNTGLFLEGLSIYADITNNTSWVAL